MLGAAVLTAYCGNACLTCKKSELIVMRAAARTRSFDGRASTDGSASFPADMTCGSSTGSFLDGGRSLSTLVEEPWTTIDVSCSSTLAEEWPLSAPAGEPGRR